MRGSSRRKLFHLSGYNKEEKKTFEKLIIKLGAADYRELKAYDVGCTHLIVKRPCRSEKFLCALANGVPIVTDAYLRDSYAAGKWLPEEKYIWSTQHSCGDPQPNTDLITAPLRCFTNFRRKQRRTLDGWVCAVKVKEEENQRVFSRILRACGAVVKPIPASVTSTRHIPTALTHLFTEPAFKNNFLPVSKQGVHVLVHNFIGDFLITGRDPTPAQYIIPYEPVIDLCDSPLPTDSASSPESDVVFLADNTQTDYESPAVNKRRIKVTITDNNVKRKENIRRSNTRSSLSDFTNTDSKADIRRIPTPEPVSGIPQTDESINEPRTSTESNVSNAGVKRLSSETMECSIRQKRPKSEPVEDILPVIGSQAPYTKSLKLSTPVYPQIQQEQERTTLNDSNNYLPGLDNSPIRTAAPATPQKKTTRKNLLLRDPKQRSIFSFCKPSPRKEPQTDMTSPKTPNLNESDTSMPSRESTPGIEVSEVHTLKRDESDGLPSVPLRKSDSTNSQYKVLSTDKLLNLTPAGESVLHDDTSHINGVSCLTTSVINSTPQYNSKKRRHRCGWCLGCRKDDCGLCTHCLDKPKFGELGRQKQACKMKTCTGIISKGQRRLESFISTKVERNRPCSAVTTPAGVISPMLNGPTPIVAEMPRRLSSDSDVTDSSSPSPDSESSTEDPVDEDEGPQVPSIDPYLLRALEGIDKLSVADKREILKKFSEVEQNITQKESRHGKPSQIIMEMPVSISRQVKTQYDDNHHTECGIAVNILNANLSPDYYPTSDILKQTLNLLLTTGDLDVLHSTGETLTHILNTYPPYTPVTQPDQKNTNNNIKYMRDVYLKALFNKNHFGVSYLHYMEEACKLLHEETNPSTNTTTDNHKEAMSQSQSQDDDDGILYRDPEPESNLIRNVDKEELKPNSTGAKIFIKFILQLILADCNYPTSDNKVKSMLLRIFETQDGPFKEISILKGDCKLAFKIVKELISLKELDILSDLIKVLNSLILHCENVNKQVAVRQMTALLSDSLYDLELSSLSHLLVHKLPYSLSYRICRYILNGNIYDRRFVCHTLPQQIQSLASLIGNFWFLIPPHISKPNPCAVQKTKSGKVNLKGETHLHKACIKNNVEWVRNLLAIPETDVNAKDNAGWTPLHEAANHGHATIVKLLLSYRPPNNGVSAVVNVAVTSKDGITPLHDAVGNGNLDCVKLLIEHGGKALLTMKDSEGNSPISLARNYPHMLELLETAPDQPQSHHDVSSMQLIPSDDLYYELEFPVNLKQIERYCLLSLSSLSLYINCHELTDNDRKVLENIGEYLTAHTKHLRWMSKVNSTELLPTSVLESLNSYSIFAL